MVLPRGHSLASLIAVSFLFMASPAHAQYAYRYFKDPVAINLDTSRIAVMSNDVRAVSNALSRKDLEPQSVAMGPFQRWTYAELPQGLRDATQLPQRICDAGTAPDIDFISPVFLDPRNEPLLVTPWIFVRFNEDVAPNRAEQIITDSRAGQITDRNYGMMPGVYRLRASAKNGIDVLDAANQLAMRPDVRFAEPDFVLTGHTDLIPNDAGFSQCWGHLNTGQAGGLPDFDMDTTDAWDITIGLPSIIVVVMDVGAQQNHPDINQIPGQDFTGEGSVGGGPNNPCDNHGTCVASCVSGIINNGIGTVGSAPGCKVFSARIGSSSTPCSTSFSSSQSMVIAALAQARTIGAKVTNSSFSYGSSATLTAAYSDARNMSGIINFAAAGNGGTSSISYPASANGAVTAVAALNRFGGRASFSQYGVGLDFSAPGEAIYMADRTGADGYEFGDYTTLDGTSFATPYTCGVAALVFSVKPNLTPTQVEFILSNTCVDLGSPGYDTGYGFGAINAFAAVTYAQSIDTDAPTPNPMTFSIPPQAASDTSITMQAALATDNASTVQYFFDYVSGSGGHDSGYQASRDYTDTGLIANSFFNYRVKARDTSSPFQNETAFSAIVLAGTAIETPTNVQFGTVTDTSIDVQAAGSFSNVGFGSTGFYFEMTPAAGAGANQWIGTASTTITGLNPCTNYTFRVKARNFQSVETAFTAPAPQSTTGCLCVLPGDINGDSLVNGDDIGGYARVKLGVPAGGDNAACADFGNNDLDLDTAEFVTILLGP
jgi:subtilisin family serine protease